jgi:hypothetical protein
MLSVTCKPYMLTVVMLNVVGPMKQPEPEHTKVDHLPRLGTNPIKLSVASL